MGVGAFSDASITQLVIGVTDLAGAGLIEVDVDVVDADDTGSVDGDGR